MSDETAESTVPEKPARRRRPFQPRSRRKIAVAAGERIVVAPVDITALRHERATRRGHDMLAHLRTEAYPVYLEHRYPPAPSARLSFDRNLELIEEAKRAEQPFAVTEGRKS